MHNFILYTAVFFSSFFLISFPQGIAKDKKSSAMKALAKMKFYLCPEHPTIPYPSAGKCLKCKTTLKLYQKPQLYHCPMKCKGLFYTEKKSALPGVPNVCQTLEKEKRFVAVPNEM
ncbi:MAG: hypothetical protein D6805_08565 [Planctomycetota bacterium]|nr:MAG: hypothetical protein D6805_08565 [Planctomycetota bacterium]